MSVSYDDFIRRLKEERIRNQLTKSTMSKNAQMHPSHYFKVEKGYNRFSFCELQNICATELDIYYIFTGKRGTGINQYDYFLKNADVEQIFGCLQMVNFVANLKRVKGPYREEWEEIYSEIKYLAYVDIGLSDERNIFRAYREYNGLTQIEMAGTLGVDVKKLRALESNKLIPDSEIIFKMYEKYGISPSAFLRNKKCIQSEIAYLLNSHSGKVAEELLMLVRTTMFFIN